MNLRDRIARLYQLHPRGARARVGPRRGKPDLGQTWLAREAEVSRSTVKRWIELGEPSRYGALILERLEEEAGIVRMSADSTE